MSIFKKSVPKAEVKINEPTVSYPINVVYWNDHFEAIANLIKDSDMDLYEFNSKCFFNAKVVPEPDNEYDPHAIKVYAAPRGRNKTWYDIGYISSNDNISIRPDIKKTVAGTHYWSLRAYFYIKTGLELSLYLTESKFNR